MESDARSSGSPGPRGAAAYSSPTGASSAASGGFKPGAAEAYTDPDYAGSAASAPSGKSNGHGTRSAADAVRDGLSRFGELKEYASYFVAAKLDSYKTSVRNLLIYAVLGLLGLMIGCAMLATASVLLCLGVAHAIGTLADYLFGPRWFWLGDLLFGLLVFGGLAGGVIFGMKYLTKTFKKQLVAKYEDRQRQQRSEFGHDVEQRAVEYERRHPAART